MHILFLNSTSLELLADAKADSTNTPVITFIMACTLELLAITMSSTSCATTSIRSKTFQVHSFSIVENAEDLNCCTDSSDSDSEVPMPNLDE
eukprot:CAMPEP_0183470626 /NCGR_PEP_ID=MMETSP0370-20130417/156626_1 /TAXON_ID=268820 /ORGANISM="Peridinium aciculiferum, Strain PAER-2" /LENGTH=91 /DNA_ID=CAMNT_0025663163 /DNA_START=8 /DNA_END=280 /DNA_ORIENTATION=+